MLNGLTWVALFLSEQCPDGRGSLWIGLMYETMVCVNHSSVRSHT